MARNIVILLVCGVLVFALVWKMAPGVLATALPFPVGRTAVAQEEETQPTVAEPEQRGAHKALKTVKTAKTGGVSSNSVARNFEQAAPANHAASMDTAMAQPTTYQAYAHRRPHVTSESATLYSSNTATGRVLRILKKDDPLELHFKVINGGQEWNYVNVPDQHISGFLPGESMVE
jgi:hypothetical protein